jgi:hypothetical protein
MVVGGRGKRVLDPLEKEEIASRKRELRKEKSKESKLLKEKLQ